MARSTGFTLFEVVIALAIAALGLAALMAAASTGLGNSAAADRYIEATRRAQSHLAEIGATASLVTGVRSGDDGAGFSWRTRIGPPVVQEAARGNAGPALALYPVEVTMSWRNGNTERNVTLQSQRVSRP
jgi:prepilin-type N-terminal cleavage/methylation domain-containing protein